MSENKNEILVDIKDLKVYFPLTRGIIFQRKIGDVKAVDGVSFHLKRGETLGLVGESGCGKTTTGRAIMRLEKSTAGQIIFDGDDITRLSPEEMRPLRRQMQMIFQDPYGCLNPRMTAGDIIGEPLIIHGLVRDKNEYKERVLQLFEIVGLNPAMVERHPHEFSGGQRQRIGVARALSVQPDLIICDEPVSALDVSIQAQIINLLEELQNKFGLTYLFIAHDLAVVRHISDRTAVMYLGHIVEIASRTELYRNPLHPYTEALLSAIPIPDPEVEETRNRIILKGEVPSPLMPPTGCKFHPRCPLARFPLCLEESPELKTVDNQNHWVACHLR